MFTSLMKIAQLSVHATQSKLTIGFSQPDLKHVKYTTVVMTADACSSIDSNLKRLLSHHVDFHQIFGSFASNNSTTYSKRYGLIFTSMATHAVLLEMCHDLSLHKSALTDFWRDFWSFADRNSRIGILQKSALTTQRTLQLQKKNWWPPSTAPWRTKFLDTTKYLGNSTPPMHHDLVRSGNVSFVASKTLYTPSLDLKPSQMILSTPCCAGRNSLWMHDPSRTYCLLLATSKPWPPTISLLEERLTVCLQELILSH